MNNFPISQLCGNIRSKNILEMALNYPVIIAEESLPIIEDRCIAAHLDPDINNENNEIQINNENQTKKGTTKISNSNFEKDNLLEDVTNITEI